MQRNSEAGGVGVSPMLSAAEVTRAAGGEGTILSQRGAAPSQSGLKEVGEAVDQSLLRKQGVMRILRPLDDRPCPACSLALMT